MPSTFWPRNDLDEARSDKATSLFDEMVAGFEERTRPAPKPDAVPEPQPAAMSFSIDRSGLMPWAESAAGAVQGAAGAVKQAAVGLFDLDALTPWKPKPEPTMQSGLTPASGTPSAMPQISATGGPSPDEEDDEQYIRQAAIKRGIDPDVAVRVANTEGGAGRGGRARQNMQGAPAYGHFQLYIGGPGNGAMGDEALAAGIDPRDPNQWRQAIDFALDRAVERGWQPFQGAAAAGIGDREGIGQSARPGAVQAEQTPAAQGQAPTSLSGITPEQFGLGDADAEAICGPVLAMAFAKSTGRNPTIAEAKQMAAQNGGWTSAQGMGGPEAMANTLRSMGIAATYKPGALDVETIRRETQNGNPVGINTQGHYFVVEGVDAQGNLDLGNSAKALRASGGRQWFRPEEIESLGMGAPTGAIYKDSPSSPTPSVAASAQNAAPASPPVAAASPQSPAATPPAAGDASSDEMVTVVIPNSGGQTMQVRRGSIGEGPGQYKPSQGWQIAGESAPVAMKTSDIGAGSEQFGPNSVAMKSFDGADGLMGPGDGGSAPTPYEQPFDPDQGPREATPGSVGASALPQRSDLSGLPTDQELAPRTEDNRPYYGPETPATPAIGAAQNARAGMEADQELAPRPAGQTPLGAAGATLGQAIEDVGQKHDEIVQATAARRAAEPAPESEASRTVRDAVWAATDALGATNRVMDVVNTTLLTTPQATADAINVALEAAGLGRSTLGVSVLGQQFGVADVIDLGPLSTIGTARGAGMMIPAAGRQFGTGVAGAIERGTGAAVRAAGRGARSLAEEGARQLTDLAPSPSVIERGTGGLPPRRSLPTVEVLESQIENARNVAQRARAMGNTAQEQRAMDVAWSLESDLVDARNARTALEPAIESDIGRRVERMPYEPDVRTDPYTTERVAPTDDLSGPVSIPTNRPGMANAALPFDPASAALGAGGGLTNEDEEFDPTRAAAGMAVAGITGKHFPGYQRVMQASARRAARLAQNPNHVPLNPLQWTGELVKSVGYSSMIGLRTASVNLLGNTGEPIWAGPKELTRAMLPQRLGGRGHPNEFGAWVAGQVKAIRDVPGETVDALAARGRYATNPDQPNLSEQTINPIAHAVALLPELGGRVFSGLPDAIFGTLARGAGEEMAAVRAANDAGLKGPALKAKVAALLSDAQAVRAGTLKVDDTIQPRIDTAQQVLDAVKTYGGTMPADKIEQITARQIAMSEGLSGKELSARVRAILADTQGVRNGTLVVDTTMPGRVAAAQAVLDHGQAFADDMTYRNPLGKVSKSLEGIARLGNAPVLGTLNTPFFTTPQNMRLRLLERTPAGAFMNTHNRPGTTRTKFDRVYDTVVGTSVLTALTLGYAAQGKMTGSGPDDPEKRKMLEATGWRPYSTLMPNPVNGEMTYVPNRYLGPYGPALNVIGEMHDAQVYGKADASQRERWTDYAKRFGKLVQDDIYASGLTELVKLADDPAQGAASYLAGLATRLTPYSATNRDIATANDPLERQVETGKDVGFWDEVGQRWRQGTGVGRQELNPKTDVRGQPMENPQQGLKTLLPKTSEYQNDPLITDLLGKNADLGKPRESFISTAAGADAPDGGIGTREIKLTAQEKQNWQQYRWQTLQETAQGLKNDPEFAKQPQSVQRRVWQSLVQSANKTADGMVRADIGDQWDARVQNAPVKQAS